MRPAINDSTFLANSLRVSVLLILLLITLGCAVYYFWFGHSIIDAFYMTIITIATVGFGEVRPLDDEGKIFTSILILLSVFIFAYAVTSVSAYLVSINSVFDYKLRKMEKKISNLENHIIICGYGRNGRQAAEKLNSFGREFVVIEQDENALRDLADNGFLFVSGNATEDETLLKSGVKHAGNLITTLPSDTDNVFISLTSRQMNSKIKIVSRASDESSIRKLKFAGANNIIMPDKIGGDHMASLIVAPDLIEFLDNLSVSTHGNMNIQEIFLYNMPEVRTLRDLDIKDRTGCIIIGYKNSAGDYIINPDNDLAVSSEGRIIVLGNNEQIQKFNSLFNLG
jgi:voltage-gated potassium channel